MHSKKRELEVLVEEEARLGADIRKSQTEIKNLMKGLEDVEELLAEVSSCLSLSCRQGARSQTWSATTGCNFHAWQSQSLAGACWLA